LVGVAAAVATSLLTLYAVVKIWNRAFWQPLADPEDDTPVPFDPAVLGGSLHGRSSVGTATQRETTWKNDTEGERLPFRMAMPTIALGLVTVALTVFGAPLFSVADRAADELQERTPYIEAVLGDG